MKILFVCSTFPPVIGGAETYARTLVDGLRNRGNVVRVVTDGTRVTDAEPEADVHRLTEFVEAFERPDKVRWQQMQFSLLDEMEKILASEDAPDVVHANGQEGAIVGSMLASEYEVPLLATFHEMRPQEEGFGRGRCRFVYQHLPIRFIIAGSRVYQDKAFLFGAPPERVRTIYHGVEVDRFPRIRESEIRKGSVPHVLCLARLKARKGLMELVEAASHLKNQGVEFTMTIAGTCSSASLIYAEKLQTSIDQLGLTDVVAIDQSVRYEDVPALMERSDVYVQPSYEEGLGLAVLEALAAGLPTAASAIPAFREIIQDGTNGLLFPSGDVESMSESLRVLLSEPELRHRFASEGPRTVSRYFSSERMIDETLALYYEALQPTPEPLHV
ncbi:glycosyltransferase [Streptomyces sp. 3MP-14]|uniref:D-inositol 3-phosphate glycosyltransferase n=1 Tax=Streptomyces mimosae TaxID=2586635 RepID=A0A5N6AC76_9ACTN|nr:MULTISPECIES: glycosyltransferase family 4 protein [Streptomyces]KAB8166414.1 glycosyltransferase [Streptomyces mimosae]KAB8174207.1 glycosyltransferase [Streptomyces sp. 3MP-14]